MTLHISLMYYESNLYIYNQKEGVNMEQEVTSYIKHHTFFLACIVTVAFVVLFAGQIYLFRQNMALNKMLSEGLMQIKEIKNDQPTPTPTPEPSVSISPAAMKKL